jgi:hypothetical protein
LTVRIGGEGSTDHRCGAHRAVHPVRPIRDSQLAANGPARLRPPLRPGAAGPRTRSSAAGTDRSSGCSGRRAGCQARTTVSQPFV